MEELKLQVAGGELAISVMGPPAGQLVVCVPGMGESRKSFRHLMPMLAAQGWRAAAFDLRGHGDSDAEFPSYDDPAAAADILAVIGYLGHTSAVLVGNSMGAAAAVIVAAQQPQAVDALLLLGPFVRNRVGALGRFAMRAALLRPWGPTIWRHYYRSLFGSVLPDDHYTHVEQSLALLRRPGRWRAFQRTAATSHQPAASSLAQVSAPTLVIMGDRDPDFPNPIAEAQWGAGVLDGDCAVVPDAGHYPMGEQPDLVGRMIINFLREAG
ncbi:alpha/beta fold hydrolase [Buchananella hordeovulneris]|uniref:alpha/beta fold hydrolase n=1 Tax=Buchananella hordeovulneris TaxID=52770 RepID=UPI000F5E85BD|nr:alpha/beta hydrolase [Buchananella hordeovulneris]